MRTWYKVTQKFTYKDGTPGGILQVTVNSRKAVDRQLENNHKWLAAHGHKADGEPVIKPTAGLVKGKLTL